MSQQNELPADSWANKPKPNQEPLDEESIQKIQEAMAELKSKENNSSKFFKINDGEQVEVFFDMKDKDTGFKMVPGFDKDSEGNKKLVRRYNFVLWNEKTQTNQQWAPSDTWAKRIFQAMADFGPGLLIRRTGKDKGTDYTFLPPGFKRAM